MKIRRKGILLGQIVVLFLLSSDILSASETWPLIATEPYAGGTLKEERFVNPQNQEEIFVRRYYTTGQLLRGYYLKKEKMHGPAKIYYRNGALRGEASFAHGKWEGELKAYSEDGRVLREGHFNGGDGVEKEYDAEGHLKAETSYENQKRHGIRKEYYRNGSLKYEDTFHRNYRVERKKYSKDGTLEFAEKYQENWVNRTLFYLAVNLNETIDPDVVKKYYLDGSLKEEVTSRMGTRDGISRVYHRNGLLKYEDTFRNGRFLRRKYYDFEGRLLGEADLRGGWARDFSRLLRDKKVVTTQAGSGGGGGGGRDVSLINYEKRS